MDALEWLMQFSGSPYKLKYFKCDLIENSAEWKKKLWH